MIEDTKPTPVRNNKQSVLRPSLVLSHVFGFTFFYRDNSRWGKKAAHRLGILILLILALINEIPSIRFWVLSSEGLHGTLVRFETSSRWSIFFLNFFLTTCKSGKIKSIVEGLFKCELDLTDEVGKKVFRLHLIHLACNFAFIVFYDVLGHDIVWANANYKSFTSSVYVFNDFMILWPSYEFSHITNLMRECFKGINTKMKGYYVVNGKRNSDAEIKRDQVIKFRQIHLELCDLSSKITYALRALISDVISYNFYEYEVYMDFAINVVWGSMYMFMVVQMIAIGDIATYESQKTSVIIHQLINNYYHDNRVEKELEIFSMQIKHHRAVFTLWLFDLNFTLLHTIIGTLTTYFIIIITFNGEWGQEGLSGWDFSPSDYASND